MNQGGCGGTNLSYNDDDCGLQSTISWTATFTGTVTVLVSEYNCINNSDCMTLQWRCTTCGLTPPTNNVPCNSEELIINTTCNYLTFDNTDATNSSVASPGCANYNGSDVWFYFIIDNLNDDININTDDGDITDGGMSIYSGSNCNNLTLIECDDDDGTGLMPKIRYYINDENPNIGDTIWIRFWEYGGDVEGEFDICVQRIEHIDGDCQVAETICDDETIQSNPTGDGNYDELTSTNSGCLDAVEHYTNWIFFHSEVDNCEICFDIITSNNINDTDYDWVIWSGIQCPPTSNPIRCSSIDGTCATGVCNDTTGMRSFATDVSDYNGSSEGDGFTSCITANAGDEFTLIIDNWNGSGVEFELVWHLCQSDALDCDPLPVEFITSYYDCSNKILYWNTQSEINNDYFSIKIGDYNHGTFIEDTIINIIGNGNSNEINNYEYYLNYNNKYIELWQTDYDGITVKLNTQFISCSEDDDLIVSLSPNPANENEPININGGEFKTIQIYDMLGKEIYIEIVNNQIIGLSEGMYIVIIDNHFRFKLIIKQ